jgi:signal transduction histidine kinase
MKSIRASLIVYFWVLLGLGLGTASVLVYRTAGDSLRAKQDVNRQLLETQFKKQEQEENQRFDKDLLIKANIIASQIQLVQHQPGEMMQLARLLPLGLMNDSQAPLFSLLWRMQGSTRSPAAPLTPASPFTAAVVRRLTAETIKADESKMPHEDADPGTAEYFQVDSDAGAHWQPPHVGERPLFEMGTFDPAKGAADWIWDTVALPNGHPGRRVQFKTTANQVRYVIFRGGGRGRPPSMPDRDRPPAPGPGDRPPSPGGDRLPPSAPPSWIVVHCVSETNRRDEAIEGHRAALADELADMEQRGHETLSELRGRLVAIVLITFLLTTIGAYVLVGVGLVPLRKVSEAVSQVSPRDFKLPLSADETLPRELAPIRDRLQGTLDELRKAFEREKQAAADISHELRTPVASMLTTVEVALRKPRSAEEYRRTLEDCRGVARQMRHLVERLMALARLDAGSDKLRPRPIDVGELVRECAALVKPLAGERGLEIRVHCSKPVVWTTDPDKFREVLINLLHNAVQYNRPDGAIDVSAQAGDGWLDVQVHDTGVGISKEAFDHIFERFYRADPSRHADDLHAGLGLSIVKGYVGLLGGTITVDSAVGQGSTFRVRLPNAAAAA